MRSFNIVGISSPLSQRPACGPVLGGARHERLVHLPAQLAHISIGHKGDIRRPFEREAPAGLALLLRRLLRHRARGVRQAGEVGFARDQQLPRLGRVEHVLGKPARHQGKLLLDFLETRLFVRRQLGAGKTEITQRVIDDFFLRRRQLGVFRRRRDGLVTGIQALVLRQLGVILAQAREVFVVHRAQRIAVQHAVKMRHRRPQPCQSLLHVLDRLREVVPGATVVTDASSCSSARRLSASNRSSAGLTCSGRMTAKRGSPEISSNGFCMRFVWR